MKYKVNNRSIRIQKGNIIYTYCISIYQFILSLNYYLQKENSSILLFLLSKFKGVEVKLLTY